MFEWLFGKPKTIKPVECEVPESTKPKKETTVVEGFSFGNFLYTDGEKYYYLQYERIQFNHTYDLKTIDGELITTVRYIIQSYRKLYFASSKEEAAIFDGLKKVEEKDIASIYELIKNKDDFINILINHSDYCAGYSTSFHVDGYSLINKELLIICDKIRSPIRTERIPKEIIKHMYSVNINSEKVLKGIEHKSWFINQLVNRKELNSEIITEDVYREKYHHIIQLHEAAQIEEVNQRYMNYIQWHLDYHANVNEILDANAADIIPPINTYEKFKLFIDVKRQYFNILKYHEEIQFDDHYPKISSFNFFAINYFDKGIKK